MVVIVDFDSTMVDTHTAVLDLYREETGDMSTEINHNTGWNIQEICPLWTDEQCKSAFKHKRLFELMKPFAGAIFHLEQLMQEGHRVVVCTIHGHEGIGYKGALIKRMFPFVQEVIYIDNGLKMNKDLIAGDIIIDDNIGNLTNSRCEFKVCYGDYDWNKDWELLRVTDWKDLYDMVCAIDEAKMIEALNE